MFRIHVAQGLTGTFFEELNSPTDGMLITDHLYTAPASLRDYTHSGRLSTKSNTAREESMYKV
jgi:hypothetical protein